MLRQYTLEYWKDEGWFVGRIREVPGVFSQGESLKELEDNVRDAYKLVMKDHSNVTGRRILTKRIGVRA